MFTAPGQPIGIVGNRINLPSANCEKLEQFLACSGVSTVCHFRDTPVYSEAADDGAGVIEMRETAQRKIAGL